MLALDEAVIKLEDIPRLRECAPTAEELEMLQPYLDEPDLQGLKLAPAESYLLRMSEVCCTHTLSLFLSLSPSLSLSHTHTLFLTHTNSLTGAGRVLLAADERGMPYI